jgi:Pyruvate/2-oxoacid:ferredoxin oxidoreductase gamma subunit
MKRIANEIRKARSRNTLSLAAATGGTFQHPLLNEILAADKRRLKAAQQMNLPVLRLAPTSSN